MPAGDPIPAARIDACGALAGTGFLAALEEAGPDSGAGPMRRAGAYVITPVDAAVSATDAGTAV